MLDVIAYTPDGKPVITGLHQFRSTYGLPIDYILKICKERGFVPHWETLAREYPLSKIQELTLAISDIYG